MQENPTTSLAVVDKPAMLAPKEILAEATEQARVLAGFIETQRLFSMIQGRRYVRCEGWTTLAKFNGVSPREVSNESYPDGHYVAKVQLVRLSDGAVLAEASAECGGPDEPMWQNRPPYARRSMAATRATGKACRLAYSWIMALSGYEVTPAEEIPDAHMNGHSDPPAPTDGKLRVVGVREQKGKKSVFWIVTLSDGREATVFDADTADLASNLGRNQTPVQVEVAEKPGPGGKVYRNLKSISVAHAEAPVVDAEVVPDDDSPF